MQFADCRLKPEIEAIPAPPNAAKYQAETVDATTAAAASPDANKPVTNAIKCSRQVIRFSVVLFI